MNHYWKTFGILCGTLLLIALVGCRLSNQINPPTAPVPAEVEITVYFTDTNRYNVGTEPFEAGVSRSVPADANLPEAVIAEFFKGPTGAERAAGLEAITSGFTGMNRLEIRDGVAHLYLDGPCASKGAAYTIAQLMDANLTQFDEITAVKIYDQDGETEDPAGPGGSIPFCLEP